MSRLSRLFTFAFAAVQFALPGMASVADGLFATGARNNASHMEDVARGTCKPPHAADCAICRFLSSTNSRAAQAAIASLALEHSAVSPDEEFFVRAFLFSGSSQPRAPPSSIV
jgi:hypothetical protein